MADPLGVSFSPTGPGGPNAQRPSPVQQAIQTLSLRIPTHAGASAFTPQSLLASPGSGALGGGGSPDALLELLKKLLFGGQGQPGGGMPDPGNMGSGGSFPSPGFLPGGTPGGPIPPMPDPASSHPPGTPDPNAPPVPDPLPSSGPIGTQPVPMPPDPSSQNFTGGSAGFNEKMATGPSETSFPMPTMRRGLTM